VRQEHVLVAHAPEHHAAGLERRNGYSLGKIRSPRKVGISHVDLPVVTAMP
jgi:hypothetical protein